MVWTSHGLSSIRRPRRRPGLPRRTASHPAARRVRAVGHAPRRPCRRADGGRVLREAMTTPEQSALEACRRQAARIRHPPGAPRPSMMHRRSSRRPTWPIASAALRRRSITGASRSPMPAAGLRRQPLRAMTMPEPALPKGRFADTIGLPSESRLNPERE